MKGQNGERWIVSPDAQELLDRVGIASADALFVDPRIVVWRDLEERQNGTLDFTKPDGSAGRLHIKRDKHRHSNPVATEAQGVGLLNAAGIRSTPLVAWGSLADGRSCLLTEQLYGHQSADRCLETGLIFDQIFESTCKICAMLHGAGLHHRDLYLNHFYIDQSDRSSIALIDAARVKRLPMFFASRWIVKDLAQFLFSTLEYATQTQRDAWLCRYCELVKRSDVETLRPRVSRKAAWIERHDQKLRAAKPKRNLRLSIEM